MSTGLWQIQGAIQPAALYLLSTHNFPERGHDSVHLLGGVVVHQSDPEKAPSALYPQAFGEIQCIVVAIPGEEAAFPKPAGQL